MFEDTNIIFYAEDWLNDDGYEGVAEDDRDAEYYENEYGSLIDMIEDMSEYVMEDVADMYWHLRKNDKSYLACI